MKRERITITVDSELLLAVDEIVDNEKIRNRSHAIEYLLKQSLSLSGLSKAILVMPNHHIKACIKTLLTLQKNWHFIVICENKSIKSLQDDLESFENLSYNITHIPADFGISKSFLLIDEILANDPVIIVDFEQIKTDIPESLLPIFHFHQTHGAPITQVISSGNKPIFYLVEPGNITSFNDQTFKLLAASGKVRAYVY